MYPRQYKYTIDHQWIELTEDGCRIGITHHAQQQLGDVVFIALPEEGARLAQGQPFSTIETCDAILELCAPVSGEVIAVNASLNRGPAVVNADPHGSWIVAVKLTAAESTRLLDAAAYMKLVGHVVKES